MHRWGLAALALISLLYIFRLDQAPVFVGGDEAHFALHAQSLATTGRDLNGTRFPLFVLITDPLVPNNSSGVWYQPFLFYVIAVFLKVMPFGEVAIRLPTALIAILNIWLVYAVGRKLFADRTYALVAALLLAMTPAQVILSRQALDYICPLPFVLGWAWCLLDYLERGHLRSLFLAGLLLGVGVFSYIAAWAWMPMFLALTLVILLVVGGRRPVPLIAVCGGFLLPLMALAPWLLWHPEMLTATLSRYKLGSGQAGGVAQGFAAIGNFDLGKRLALYWDYFNPSFLFIVGGSNPTQATAQVGVFLLPVAIFLVAGGVALWRQRRSAPALMLLTGFLTAPLPIVLTMPEAPQYSIARALMFLPFGALIGAFGVQMLMAQSLRSVRAATIVLLAAMPLQFGLFARDYFSDYQVRSAPRLDPINTRDVARYVIARDSAERVSRVYLSDNMDDKSVRWKFYMLKDGRPDLWDRTQYFSPERFEPGSVDAGSLLVLYASDLSLPALLARGDYSVAATITELAGEPSTVVVRRRPR